MESVIQNKKELRKRLLEERANTPEEQKTRIDRAVCDAVLNADWFRKAENIFVYYSTEEEISTRGIIAEALRRGKKVFLPKCLKGHRMEARRVQSPEDLTEQTYGIPEPGAHCAAAQPEELDLCLVPALACDRSGYRLGYGGGFYDRFLPLAGGVKAVLCADSRLFEKLPAEPFDIRCGLIVTENEVISV